MVAVNTPGNSTVGQPRPAVIHNDVAAGTLVYADNTPQTLDIPRSEVYRGIQLDITAQPTAVSGWTAANLGPAELASIIQSLQIMRNGSDALVTFTGEQIMLLQNRWYGSKPISNVGTVGTANPQMSCSVFIPFETPNIRKPFSTMLNSGKCSSLSLNVQWGNAANALSTATGWTTLPSVAISYLKEYWPPTPQGKDTTPIFWFRRCKPKNAVIPAGAAVDLLVPLNVNTVYHGWFLTGPMMPYCTKIKLVTGGNVLQTVNMPGKIYTQKIRRNVQPAGWTTTTTNEPSALWFEAMPDGMITQLLNARGISDLSFLMTFTSANPGGTLNLVTSEIFGNDSIAGG